MDAKGIQYLGDDGKVDDDDDDDGDDGDVDDNFNAVDAGVMLMMRRRPPTILYLALKMALLTGPVTVCYYD